MSKDYYKILQIPRNATKEDIKKAYRALAHQFHPDKQGGSEEKFKEINEAYQVLGDERKRAQYDQFGSVFEGRGQAGGHSGWQGGFGGFDFSGFSQGEGDDRGFSEFDFSDVFEDIFSFMGGPGQQTRARPKKGKDIQIDLEVSFEEMVFGGKHDVSLQKLSKCARCEGRGAEPSSKLITCSKCHGTGKIEKTQKTFLGNFAQVMICSECQGRGQVPEVICRDCLGRGVTRTNEKMDIMIPKGIADGDIVKLSGKGEASLSGGVPGDLYVRIHVLAHKVFRRQNNDLTMVLPVSFSQATLGDKIEIETIDGKITLKVPEGTESGDVLKVRGKGVPSTQGYERGDLLIEVRMATPKKLSRKARELVEGLKAEGF